MNRQSLKMLTGMLALGFLVSAHLPGGTSETPQPETHTSTEMLQTLTEPLPPQCMVNGVKQTCPFYNYKVYKTPTPPEYKPCPHDSQIPSSVLNPNNPLFKYFKKWKSVSPETRQANVIYAKLYAAYAETGMAEGAMAGGSYSWGDVHLTQFDGAKCDTNNSVGWHNYYSKGQTGVGDEQLNIDQEPWTVNKAATIIKGFALKANYGGKERQILYVAGQEPTLNGQPISKLTETSGGKFICVGDGVWIRWDGSQLTVLTPATEYAILYKISGELYGNISLRPRRAPHVGGYPDGMVGQSVRFDGKVHNSNPVATPTNTCDNFTIMGAAADYKTSGPFETDDSHSRYGKNILPRPLDGFYPIIGV